GRAATGGADPDAADDHPDEGGVDQRHRREDVAVVEEPERGGGRQEQDQVEIAQRERPPKVREPDEEDEAERTPDPRTVDLRTAERALRAAGHPPRDLGARPRLGDGAPPRSRRAAGQARRRNDQSLLPTKLSGVTSAIATACPTSLPRPSVISRWSTSRFAPRQARETIRKRIPWAATPPRRSWNVQ